MIVLKMEMWRGGNSEDTYPLGAAHIWNKGGTNTRGEYGYQLFDKAGRKYAEGEVKNFPRKVRLAWDLLYRVLRHALGDRNQD